MYSSPATPTGTGAPRGSSTYTARPGSGRPMGTAGRPPPPCPTTNSVAVMTASVGP